MNLKRPSGLWFYGAAAFAAGGALFHLAAVLIPRFGAAEYPAGYSVWRHVVFIAVNGAFAWLLVRRPIWLVWAWSVLMLQVLGSHAEPTWQSVCGSRPVDWFPWSW